MGLIGAGSQIFFRLPSACKQGIMQARFTGAGHTLYIYQRNAGDWRWVLDHHGCRVGESVLIGNRLLHERPAESDLKEAYSWAAQRVGNSRWNVFAFHDLKWSG
jgi:hypothetical protein